MTASMYKSTHECDRMKERCVASVGIVCIRQRYGVPDYLAEKICVFFLYIRRARTKHVDFILFTYCTYVATNRRSKYLFKTYFQIFHYCDMSEMAALFLNQSWNKLDRLVELDGEEVIRIYVYSEIKIGTYYYTLY